uniref:GDSL esterase/lipase n=1 Tax=Ananas comosus var. bracteatus TaxID=296719 RepID=A0A6V7NQ59_ANACO|nr:unnamed protein product [Ananas comosus var. bracteatus]
MFEEYKERLRTLVGEEKAASIIAESLLQILDAKQFTNCPGLGQTRCADGRCCRIASVGCVPAQRTLAGGIHRKCAHQSNELAQKYNRELREEVNRLMAKLQGTKIIYLDIYSDLRNPKRVAAEQEYWRLECFVIV